MINLTFVDSKEKVCGCKVELTCVAERSELWSPGNLSGVGTRGAGGIIIIAGLTGVCGAAEAETSYHGCGQGLNLFL